jgi:phosphoglycolate phosphatase-like HAD superfamily hydrolase
MFKGVVGLAVLVALIAALGCGGSSDSEPLTKAEFGQQGNKICKDAEQARGKIVAKVIEETDPKGNQEKAQEEVVLKAIPTYEKAAEEIGDLGAPEGEEEKVENLVEAMEEAAGRAQADPHTAVISNAPFREADKLAEELGLDACVI